jgi:hypothetical protein
VPFHKYELIEKDRISTGFFPSSEGAQFSNANTVHSVYDKFQHKKVNYISLKKLKIICS